MERQTDTIHKENFTLSKKSHDNRENTLKNKC